MVDDDALLCKYWVSTGPDDPDGHICAKEAAMVAERSPKRVALCAVHATSRRLEVLMDQGWAIIWLD